VISRRRDRPIVAIVAIVAIDGPVVTAVVVIAGAEKSSTIFPQPCIW
jgi:hypothetical protein